MAGMLRPWQFVGPKRWKGLQTHESMAALALRKPQVATDAFIKLMAWKYGNTLDSLLAKFPTKTFDTSDEYTWNVICPSEKNYQLLYAEDENGRQITKGGNMIGANQEPFVLVFDEDWTHRGATIVGDLNEEYQFVVIDEPIFRGNTTAYRVYLSGGNTDGIPDERLLPGEHFSFEANYVADDLSREVGEGAGSTHTQLRNEFSTVRDRRKVGGKMIDDKCAVGLPLVDDKGNVKVVTRWMLYVDWEFERKFKDMKNNALAYGVSNRNANGEYMDYDVNGRAVKKSAGLYQQIEMGNTIYINEFNLKVLERALLDLCSGKVEYNNRQFTLITGDAGAMDFHKAIQQETQGWSQLTLDNSSVNMIQKTTSPYHQNSLSAGYQFTQWKSPMGLIINVLVDQSYNDPVRNKITMSDGTLAYSHRMDIMDMGNAEQQNIFKCLVKALPERRGYQAGPFGNPFTGEINNMNASYDEDSAVAHKIATLGICVMDPTRTVSIIPNVLKGN